MKIAVAAALFACAFVGPAYADGAPLAAPVEQCIRGNAVKVSAAISDLNQAVDFLVEKLCAEPIAADNDRQSKENIAARTAQLKEKCAKSETDGGYPHRTKDMMCAFGDSGLDLDFAGGTVIYGLASKPPAAVALAARLLLDLRLAHENPPGK
jgi:hypothetical protein